MGSAPFAVPSLEVLSHYYSIVGVVTAPDKPQGRGLQLRSTAVKEYAVANHLPVYTPLRLRSEEMQDLLKTLRPDVQVVVAFRKLPVSVIDFPRLGTINLHASLLPNYRGAAPIPWAMINGETRTGLSTFFIEPELDTGPLLLQEEVPIDPEDHAGSLHNTLMHRGAQLLLRTVQGLVAGTLSSFPQPTPKRILSFAPKISKSDCLIDWKWSAEQVHNFVRGLSPVPGAYTFFENTQCKILKTSLLPLVRIPAGTHILDKESLVFGTTTHALAIQELQLAGKKRMSTKDFLRGRQ